MSNAVKFRQKSLSYMSTVPYASVTTSFSSMVREISLTHWAAADSSIYDPSEVDAFYRLMMVTISRSVDQVERSLLGHIRLTDVFVRKLVAKSNTLRLVLHRLAIHNRSTELLHNSLVDGVTLEQSASFS